MLTTAYTTDTGEPVWALDPNTITFQQLPAFSSAGCISEPSTNTSSRCYETGQAPFEVLALGDIQDFGSPELTFDTIYAPQGVDPSQISLAEAGPLVTTQPLGTLVEAVPQLSQQRLGNLPLFEAVLEPIGTFDPDATLADILDQYPQVAPLTLESVPGLENYLIADVPNLDIASFGNFEDWQSVPLEQVGGLGDLTWSQFPNPPVPTNAVVARLDWVLGPADGGLNNQLEARGFTEEEVLSGGNESGFNAPCEDVCPHFEVVHPQGSRVRSNLNGKKWISKAQEVEGGFGILGELFPYEPTGLQPFGDGFKVVLASVNEQRDTVDFELYFRTCKRGVPDLGCSAYFIGGIPIGSVKVGDLILIHTPTNTGTPPSVPTEIARQQWNSLQASSVGTPDQTDSDSQQPPNTRRPDNSGDPVARAPFTSEDPFTTSPAETVLASLASARTEGQIGPRQCDSAGNCSVLVGLYGVPSNDAGFHQAASPTLKNSLAQLAQGTPVSPQSANPKAVTTVSYTANSQNAKVNGINLREKFKEEFPDDGKAIALAWLQSVADKLTATYPTPITAELLAQSVMGGTHLPTDRTDGYVLDTSTLNQTTQELLQSTVPATSLDQISRSHLQ
ncbi:MAG: hypothetical protein AAFQ89_10425 [Cyanobacteria bacterium J06626_18]